MSTFEVRRSVVIPAPAKVFALCMNMDKLVGSDVERGLKSLTEAVAARKS